MTAAAIASKEAASNAERLVVHQINLRLQPLKGTRHVGVTAGPTLRQAAETAAAAANNQAAEPAKCS